jgi:diguanylate cyclase (GGDEF)-like protein/PAS domain S-box-containing protein
MNALQRLAGWRWVFDRLPLRIAFAVGLGTSVVCASAGGLYLHFLEQRLLAQVGLQVQTAVQRAADDIDQRVLVRRRALEAAAFDLTAAARALTPEQAQAFLAESSALAALFDRLVIADADGRPLAARPRSGGWREISVADRDYFRQVRDSGRLVVSEPVLGKLARAPIVTFAAPLAGPGGEFGGALIGAIVLEQGGLLDHVRDATVGATGRFVAVTRSGRFLMHPERERLMQPVDAAPDDPALARALQGVSGWMYVAQPAHAAGVHAYKAMNNAPWIVGARVDAEESLEPVRAARFSAVLVGTAYAVVLTALIAFVATRSLRPLQRLQRQVDELEAGRRNGGVDIGGTVEIRRVAEAFNRLLAAQTRLQEAVNAREAFHRSLNESSPLAIFVADEAGDWTYVNRRLEQLVGRRFEVLAADGWLQSVHEDDRREVAQQWAAAVRGNRPLEGRWRLRVDDRTVWVRVKAAPLPESAQAGGFVGALADVTAEHDAIEQAERARRRSDSIVESMSDAIVVTDECGCIAHFNAAAEALTGLARADAIGAKADAVLRFTRENGERVDLEQVCREARLTADDWYCEAADGRRVPVDVSWVRSASAAPNAAGFGGVISLRDASARRDEARRLAWQARHDSLTGLLNRRAFEQVLAQRYEAFAFQGVGSALVLLDLDHFKRVNDEGGHDAGDEMLKQVADVLRANIREADYAVRLGGDEFALILPGCPESRAHAIAIGIRAEIGALRVSRGERVWRIGVSAGVSCFALGDEDSQALVRRADAACYRAKAAGRNAVEIESVAATAAVELF